MVVHSYFDIFTYKAMSGTAVVLNYAVLLKILPKLDFVSASFIFMIKAE